MTWAMVAGAAISTVGGAMLSKNKGASSANASSAEASAAQARLHNIQADQSERLFEVWENIYQPMEESFVEEGRKLGSIANQNRSAQHAAADVAGSFSSVREQLEEMPGVNPNSQAAIMAKNRVNLEEAAASAAAQTGARQTVQDKGRAAVSDLVHLGRGMRGDASSMLSSAASGLGSAADYQARQAQSQQGRADAAAGRLGNLVGGITQSKSFQEWMNKPAAGAAPMASGGALPAPVMTDINTFTNDNFGIA